MKRIQMIYVISGVAVLLGFAAFAVKLTARDKYETAEYQVVESDGKFEIREYPDLKMATTSMQREGRGGDGSFMRLFRYISGDNEPQQKIAMTTPVFMEAGDEAGQGQMGFVLPKEVAADQTPQPSGDKVEIKTRPAGKYAVIRFAGRMSSELIEAKEAELRQWLADQDLEGEADNEYAGYDPPWTPGPMRRNEVLIRISD